MRDRGRPKPGTGISKKLLQTAAIKADGSPSIMAKELGITHQTASKHLQKPNLKKAVLSAREKALAKAQISREHIYKRLKEGTDAKLITVRWDGVAKKSMMPDYKERRENVKIALQLFDDLKKDGEGGEGTIINIMPAILVDGKELKFDVGEIIDVTPEG